MSGNVSVIGVARPPFLLLTPACLSLGILGAYLQAGSLNGLDVVLVLIGGLAAHIAVNALNEVADFESGLDLQTTRTPFSGGSGTLVAAPELLAQARRLGYGAVAVVIAVGLWFAADAGWLLYVLGGLGVVLILAYSGAIGRNRFLVFIAPGLGFGPAMVLGAEYALAGSISPLGLVGAGLCFFLVNNLLLLNQFPDREADRSVGRDNFVISLSTQKAVLLYRLSAYCGFGCLLLGYAEGVLPMQGLIGLLVFPLVALIARRASQFDGDGQALEPALAQNVAVTLLTPTLTALGVLTTTF